MLRAIIIDDEPMGVTALQVMIERHTNGVKVIASTTSPEKGIDYIEDYKPDIVFLDISMPVMNGFDVLNKLEYKNFKLVFTTAHEEFALKALKIRAFDYLLKPIGREELITCINNIVTEKSPDINSKPFSPIIELSVKDGIIFIKPESVIRVEAAGSYTVFYLDNSVKHIVSKNLKEYEHLLEHSFFYRCHHSHIVNLNKVSKMVSADGLYAQMIDGSKAEITRKNKDTFIDRLKNI